MRTSWYIEIYNSHQARRASSYDTLSNAAGAFAWIKANKRPGMILRVLAPAFATRDELNELQSLGAIPA